MHEPPRPLSPAARAHWDRLTEQIDTDGRMKAIDRDMLALYCESHVDYDQCRADIDKRGVLIQGSRGRGLVRNPACSVLIQTRTALARLSRLVPLVDRQFADKMAELDAWLGSDDE